MENLEQFDFDADVLEGKSMDVVADVAFDLQKTLGVYDFGAAPGVDLDTDDLAAVFAHMHAKISSAFVSWDSIYDAYSQTGEGNPSVDMRRVTWVNESGELAAPGAGVPHGLAADLTELILSSLALMRRLGVKDIGKLIDSVAKSQRKEGDIDVENGGIE